MVTVVKPPPKPRRARLLSKGRKLNNKKRGRPKKATPAAEKNKKNQSALDLLHAKTLSAAPPQGERAETHAGRAKFTVLSNGTIKSFKLLARFLCVYRCKPASSESVSPATSQGSALSSQSAAAEPNSSCSATPAW